MSYSSKFSAWQALSRTGMKWQRQVAGLGAVVPKIWKNSVVPLFRSLGEKKIKLP